MKQVKGDLIIQSQNLLQTASGLYPKNPSHQRAVGQNMHKIFSPFMAQKKKSTENTYVYSIQ